MQSTAWHELQLSRSCDVKNVLFLCVLTSHLLITERAPCFVSNLLLSHAALTHPTDSYRDLSDDPRLPHEGV